MNNKKLISAVILSIGLVACGGDKQASKGAKTSPGADVVVAEIGNVKITQKEIDAYLKLKRVPQQDKQRVERMVDDYLQRKTLAAAVESTDYIDEQMIKAEIDEFKNQMLISRYFEAFLNDTVNDQAIQNFYNTHQDEYQVEKSSVSHILIRTNPSMSEAELKALMTKAQEAHSKVRAGGDFAELAKQYSDDKISAKKDGSLGWIKEGAIDPSFSKKVFSMNVGEISEPFATPYGYHIVKIDEPKQIMKTPFEKASGDIRYQLRQQAKEAEMKRLLESIKVK
jgi:peptidyl-prolyl cis-trans isomerase C